VSGKSIEIPISKLLQVSTFSYFVEYMRLNNDLHRTFYEIEEFLEDEIDGFDKK